MTKTSRPGIQSGKLFSRELANGITLQAEVSPCVFMYPGYPLQVQVTFRQKDGQSGGAAYAVDRNLVAETAIDADVIRLLASVATIPCKRCSAVAFDASTIETNRAGLCERCFLDDLQANFDKSMEEERRLLKDRDNQMKAKGLRFRVTAWIHDDEGDDSQVDWYFPVRPKEERIRALLRKEGSEILDDFQVIEL